MPPSSGNKLVLIYWYLYLHLFVHILKAHTYLKCQYSVYYEQSVLNYAINKFPLLWKPKDHNCHIIPPLTESYTEPLVNITAYYSNTHLHIICLYGSLKLPLLHESYKVNFVCIC
jgi:hypothetical protein